MGPISFFGYVKPTIGLGRRLSHERARQLARRREQMRRRGRGTPPRADAASWSGRALSEPCTVDCFGAMICELTCPEYYVIVMSKRYDSWYVSQRSLTEE
jgi:hypothetical protein